MPVMYKMTSASCEKKGKEAKEARKREQPGQTSTREEETPLKCAKRSNSVGEEKF